MPEHQQQTHQQMEQSRLFDDQQPSPRGEIHQMDPGELLEFPAAFRRDEGDRLMNTLRQHIPWRQESLWIAGQARLVPRLQCWMGDAGSNYGYSGIRMNPVPWHPAVLEIKDRIESLSPGNFNSVLLNYYRNGQDSVAWHADDEAELGTDPVIASVSLGAERPFQMKRKDKTEKHQILLRHGSLLIMGKGIQNKWLHQLPKVKDLQEARINLTFRKIVGVHSPARASSK